MSAEDYRRKTVKSVTLSNGVTFKIREISARKLINLLEKYGLTLTDLQTVNATSQKFLEVLKLQDTLLMEYVVEPKIVENPKNQDELGIEEISISDAAELIGYITGTVETQKIMGSFRENAETVEKRGLSG